jgi:hypothetical protein
MKNQSCVKNEVLASALLKMMQSSVHVSIRQHTSANVSSPKKIGIKKNSLRQQKTEVR